MDDLFCTMREACSPPTWSKGVMLVRAGAVVPSRSDGESIEVRVTTEGSLVAPAVTLFPADEDWVCECNSQEACCSHAAAAVIAVRRAVREGKALAASEAATVKGTLGYRLGRDQDKLTLRRVVVSGGEETPLYTSLAAANRRDDSVSFVASQQDLAIEAVCGSFTGGTIPVRLMSSLLAALIDVPDLKLEGDEVRIAEPSCGLVLRVEDCADGFRLRLEQDPEVRGVFGNGAVHVGNALCPVRPHGINERLYRELRSGKIINRAAAVDLVGQLLPELEKRVRVVVDSATLPHADSVPVRLQLRTQRNNDRLVVLATLVYGEPPIARVDGDSLTMLSGNSVPKRRHREEGRLRKLLRDELGLEPGVEMHFSGGEALDMAAKLRGIDDQRVVHGGAAHESFYLTSALKPHLQISSGGHVDIWFAPQDEPEGVARGGGRRADPTAVLRAWQRGDEHAPLLEGGFGALPTDWLQRFGPRLADLLAVREATRGSAGDGSAPLPAFAFADLSALCEATGEKLPESFARLETLARSFDGVPEAELPDDLTARLRHYQRDGVNWLSFLRQANLGALLADDMGLGKTLQALCAIRGRTLVVAPRSVLHNWEAEAARFRPALRTHTYHGPERALDDAADLTLTTYAILRLDAEVLTGRRWDTIVLDESQAIKNPDSQVSRAAHALQAPFRIALTGTPVENRLDDLWSQIQFVNAGLLGGRQSFQERYVKPIAAEDECVAARLRERLRPFVLRRHKRDVAPELPPRTELVLSCVLDETERSIYDAVRAATRDEVVRKLDSGASTFAILEALLRLRQAACHPALIPGQAKLSGRSSSKVRLLLDTLDDAVAEGHKALVFSQWTSLLDQVEPHLGAGGIDFVRLDGSTRDRKGVVDAFQADGGPPVMLLSLKAGGTGLNLTAADHVFLLDPWWNPAAEDQAADRAHRIGQDKPVFVHRLIAEQTVEERVLALQARKRELAAAAIGDASAATRITRDDLLALLA